MRGLVSLIKSKCAAAYCVWRLKEVRLKQALYLREHGDIFKIMESDIHQQQIGDCGLLAVMGEIAIKDPTYIPNDLIEHNGNGAETVTLFNDARGGEVSFSSTVFSAVSFHITNVFPSDSVNSGPKDSVARGVKEIWPQVLEKGYAADHGGYEVINSGVYDALAMETFTGNHASWEVPAAMKLATLKNQINGFAKSSSALVTFDTPSTTAALPYHLIEDHAYMFDGVEIKHGQTFVALLNPWGHHEPNLVPVNAVGAIFDQINFGNI
jgi:Calpain family cysteine protease